MDRVHDGLQSENAWREIIFHARLGSIPAEKVQTHTNILLSKRWMRSIGRHKKYIFQLLYCIHIFQKRALLFCSLQWVVWNKVLFFSLHHSCFAMLRKVILYNCKKSWQGFLANRNDVIAQYKYTPKQKLFSACRKDCICPFLLVGQFE